MENKYEELSMEERIEGALCYFLGFITGIIFLIIAIITKKKFVSFHALQSIITFLPLYIIMTYTFSNSSNKRKFVLLSSKCLIIGEYLILRITKVVIVLSILP